MRQKTKYEWDVEECDDIDVLDHDHRNKLSEYGLNLPRVDDKLTVLVLVRDVWFEDGRLNRSWAYVKDWKLPEFFEDGCLDLTSKVPKRFHAELAKMVEKMKK